MKNIIIYDKHHRKMGNKDNWSKQHKTARVWLVTYEIAQVIVWYQSKTDFSS